MLNFYKPPKLIKKQLVLFLIKKAAKQASALICLALSLLLPHHKNDLPANDGESICVSAADG